MLESCLMSPSSLFQPPQATSRVPGGSTTQPHQALFCEGGWAVLPQGRIESHPLGCPSAPWGSLTHFTCMR